MTGISGQSPQRGLGVEPLVIATAVCPSVTLRCFVQTNKDTIVRFTASGGKIILVSGEVKFICIFAGITPSEGVKVKHSLSLAKI